MDEHVVTPEEAILVRVLDYMVEFRGLLKRFWDAIRILAIVALGTAVASGVLVWQVGYRNGKVDELDTNVTDIGKAVARIDRVAGQVDQNSDGAKKQQEATQDLFNAVFRMDCMLTATKVSCDRVGLPTPKEQP